MGEIITQREIAEKTGIPSNDVCVSLCQTRVMDFRGRKEYDRSEAKANVIAYCEKKIRRFDSEAEKWKARKQRAERL
jgi:hypothetical protein